MPQTFYDHLGVDETADDTTIKAAWRTIAKTQHPDKGGDPEKFKRACQAYDTLKDPHKRAVYDQELIYGKDGLDFSNTHDRNDFKSHFNSEHMETMFQEMFNKVFDKKYTGFSAKRKVIDLPLTLDEILLGGTKTLNLNKRSGEKTSIYVQFEGGLKEGELLKINTDEAENLYARIVIKPHTTFTVVNKDLEIFLNISMKTAALGGQITLEGIGGETHILKIKGGTQTGDTLTVTNTGLAVKGDPKRGDIFVSIFVETPQNLTNHQKKLLEECFENDTKETSSFVKTIKSWVFGH
jgi:curved DNA-binding protein